MRPASFCLAVFETHLSHAFLFLIVKWTAITSSFTIQVPDSSLKTVIEAFTNQLFLGYNFKMLVHDTSPSCSSYSRYLPIRGFWCTVKGKIPLMIGKKSALFGFFRNFFRIFFQYLAEKSQKAHFFQHSSPHAKNDFH